MAFAKAAALLQRLRRLGSQRWRVWLQSRQSAFQGQQRAFTFPWKVRQNLPGSSKNRDPKSCFAPPPLPTLLDATTLPSKQSRDKMPIHNCIADRHYLHFSTSTCKTLAELLLLRGLNDKHLPNLKRRRRDVHLLLWHCNFKERILRLGTQITFFTDWLKRNQIVLFTGCPTSLKFAKRNQNC